MQLEFVTQAAGVVHRAVEILASERERAAEDQARGDRHQHHAHRLRLEGLVRKARRDEHGKLFAALLTLEVFVQERRLALLRQVAEGGALELVFALERHELLLDARRGFHAALILANLPGDGRLLPLRFGDPHFRVVAILQQLAVLGVRVENRQAIGDRPCPLGGGGAFRGRDLVLQPDDLWVLVGVGELGVREIALEGQDPRLRGFGRRAARGGDRLVRSLLHVFDLPLDHREAVLLAARRGRRRLELALHRGDHRQVGVGLFREASHERLFHLAQSDLEPVQASFAGAQLSFDELRGVGRADLARFAVLLDEHLRQPVDDPLGVLGRRIDVPHLIGVQLRLLLGGELLAGRGAGRAAWRNRVGERHRNPAAQTVHGGVDRAALIEVLHPRRALEHRPAQQLLGHGAHALLAVDLHGADHVRRYPRRADGDGRRRLIRAGQLPHQQPADQERDRQGHDEPPLAAVEHQDVVERVETRFVHHCILIGLEVTIWKPTRLRSIRPPARRLLCWIRE